MSRNRVACCIAAGLTAGAAMNAVEPIAAEYPLVTVTDGQTPETAGRGPDAKVHGAAPISDHGVSGLHFDGRDDYLDCGAGDHLDLRERVTVACWLRPASLPDRDVGIAGKSIDAFMLTYYQDGQCWWYIGGGGNNVHAALPVDVWSHVAGTYDGEWMRLYVNGRLAAERARHGQIPGRGELYIGALPDRPGNFHGAIADVRVYAGALAGSAIAEQYAAATADFARQVPVVRDGACLRESGFSVCLGSSGALQVMIGSDRYVIETAFSYPGAAIGWHHLTGDSGGPLTIARGERQLSFTQAFGQYELQRSVTVDGHRLLVEDTLHNTATADIGILYRNELLAGAALAEVRLAGSAQTSVRMTAENPTVFVQQGESGCGWLAEDEIYRLQLELTATANCVRMAVGRFGLAAGASHTFRWTLYPGEQSADYWQFINQVRRDWQVNSTVTGPFDYFDVTRNAELVADHERLRAYLQRKRLRVIAAMPWLDYDNYNHGTRRPTTRDEYRTLMRTFRKAVKAAAPEIRVIGCIEGNLVTLPPAAVSEIHRLAPDQGQGQYLFNEAQLAALTAHEIRWQDCLLMNREGKFRYELYYRGAEPPMPFVAIAVYAAAGNDQHAYWMEQARFILEDVGLDGIYIDQFSLAFNDTQRYTYQGWDGHTVDIDPRTGEIVRRYTDGALVGSGARRALRDYVAGRGAYMLANTFPAVPQVQTGMHRFNESEWTCDATALADDEQPPLLKRPCEGHLSTPISLGVRPGRHHAEASYARTIHKSAIFYLRHGLLYYHYGTEIPEQGPGAGEFGAINHMFPLTPVALGPGWVAGRERVVACVSGTHTLAVEQAPEVLVFDLQGLPVAPDAVVERHQDAWRIVLRLRDWAQIAVIK